MVLRQCVDLSFVVQTRNILDWNLFSVCFLKRLYLDLKLIFCLLLFPKRSIKQVNLIFHCGAFDLHLQHQLIERFLTSVESIACLLLYCDDPSFQ